MEAKAAERLVRKTKRRKNLYHEDSIRRNDIHIIRVSDEDSKALRTY